MKPQAYLFLLSFIFFYVFQFEQCVIVFHQHSADAHAPGDLIVGTLTASASHLSGLNKGLTLLSLCSMSALTFLHHAQPESLMHRGEGEKQRQKGSVRNRPGLLLSAELTLKSLRTSYNGSQKAMHIFSENVSTLKCLLSKLHSSCTFICYVQYYVIYILSKTRKLLADTVGYKEFFIRDFFCQ